MKSIVLGCLLVCAGLAAADGDQHHHDHHDHHAPVQVVRVGSNGRQQILSAAAGGQRDGSGTLRKVARRGRGRGFVAQGLDAPLQPAPRALAPQSEPFLVNQPGPLPLLAPQPDPILVNQPGPLPLLAPQPAPFPVNQPGPLPLLAPQPAPFPVNQPGPLPLLAQQPFLNLRASPLPPPPAPFLLKQFNLAPFTFTQGLNSQAAAPAAGTEVVAARNAAEPAPQPTLEFGSPATLAPEVREVVQLYGSPAREAEEVYGASARDSYGSPAREADEAYGAPARDAEEAYAAPDEPLLQVVEVRDSYLPAVEEIQQLPSEAVIAVRVPVADSYAAAAAEDEANEVVEVRDSYLAAQPSRTIGVKSNQARPVEQIAIVRSQYNPPAETGIFDYAFESANGIKQEATGSMRLVDDTEVSVMKGSYSYVGADGQLYEVDWYADETGFHPTAPHFPQPVIPDHPEVAQAVAAQIRFAAEEDALAAAASRNTQSQLPSYGK